ncbi:hypothetical protein [Salinispira pacifica]
MTCSEALSRYFDLDREEEPTGELAAHLRTCSSCAPLVSRMEAAQKAAAVQPSFLQSARFTDLVMARIQSEAGAVPNRETAEEGALLPWIVAGVIILAAIPLSSFSDSLSWLSAIFGTQLDFPLHLVLGLAFTVYALLFIGSHLQGIARLLHLKTSAAPPR